jgi:drug/metabolite transporter (DMT)-like permease
VSSAAFATLLVIASAFLHAAWNAILKHEEDVPAAAATICGVGAASGVAWALVTSGVAFPTRAALAWTLLSGAGEAIYFLALARALARLPLGAAYTISRGGALLAVWPASIALLGERGSWLAAAGAALVFCGIVATGFPKKREAGAVHRRGIAWACMSAAFIAGVYLCYKRALAAGADQSALFAASLGVAWPLSVLMLGKGGLLRMRRIVAARPVAMIGAGLVCTISFLLILGALATSGAGRVLTLRNTSIVFAHVLAWLGGERPSALQIAGGALVVAGALLLGLG